MAASKVRPASSPVYTGGPSTGTGRVNQPRSGQGRVNQRPVIGSAIIPNPQGRQRMNPPKPTPTKIPRLVGNEVDPFRRIPPGNGPGRAKPIR